MIHPRLVFSMALFAGLACGFVFWTGENNPGQAQGAGGARKDVIDLAREAEKGKDVTAKAAALKKHFRSVSAAMRLYNPQSRGGIGFGPRGVAIEWKLVNLGEDGIKEETLKKEQADLRRVAAINLVLAEVFLGFTPEKAFLGRGKKEWQGDVDALKAASKSLLKAIEAKSPKDVQAAVIRINAACNNCHDGKK